MHDSKSTLELIKFTSKNSFLYAFIDEYRYKAYGNHTFYTQGFEYTWTDEGLEYIIITLK
jgi:hypothetical protein